MLKLVTAIGFNPEARFIIVIIGHPTEINGFLSEFIKVLWYMRIVNSVIMVANSETHQYDVFEDVYVLQESNKYDIYAFFPYEGGRCGDNLEAVLVNQCYSENAVELANNIDLFPNKVPDDFAGCSMTVVTGDTEPYEINVNKSTDLYQTTGLKFRGLKREYLRLITDVMKVGIHEFKDWQSLIAIGNAHGFSSAVQNQIHDYSMEASIPYLFDILKCYVPCPKSVLEMERILAVFNLCLVDCAVSRANNGPCFLVFS
jgi:hypothetical protein